MCDNSVQEVQTARSLTDLPASLVNEHADRTLVVAERPYDGVVVFLAVHHL